MDVVPAPGTACTSGPLIRVVESGSAELAKETVIAEILGPLTEPATVVASLNPVAISKEDKNAAKVRLVVDDIRNILKNEVPTDYLQMSRGILKIRKLLSGLISLATARARIQQLSDILVLWSQTLNFIFATSYKSVDCVPVKVYARELGNNISRAAILSTAVPQISRQEYPEGSYSVASGITSHVDPLHINIASKPHRRIDDNNRILTDMSPIDTRSGSDLINDAFGFSLIDNLRSEVSSEAVNINEGSFADVAGSCSTASTSYVDAMISAETEGGDPSLYLDCKTDTEERLSTYTAVISPEVKVPSPKHPDQYFEPNEVVHIDTFTYHPMYMLWQLMGWFNAGSDDPIAAPNVFGTLQLPLPSQCFGLSESNYGPKERDALIKHMLDEFKQSSPWPEVVTKSFSKIPKNTPRDRASLMGSPFLDILLGVGQVTQKISAYLQPSGLKNMSNVEWRKDPKSLQFDDMLPPDSGCNW